ncbi:MAG: hypothetical protein OCD02_14010 [Spirochaetaceae bacterium]
MSMYKIVLVIISISLLFSCTEQEYLELTGDYSIGTSVFELEDKSRLEYYSEEVSENRTIVIRAWYPIEAKSGKTLPQYNGKGVAKEFQKLFGIPSFLMKDNIGRAYTDGSPLKGKYPVVIFNHGFSSWESQNATTMEEISSNGYVVLSINHPYESLFTQFNNMDSVKFSIPGYKDKLKAMNKDIDDITNELIQMVKTIKEATTEKLYKEAVIKITQSKAYKPVFPSLKLWIEDTAFLISSLNDINLSNIIDSDNIAVIGHSFGGLVSSELSMLGISGIKCGISYDGPVLFDNMNKDISLKTPFLFLASTNAKYGKTVVDLSGQNDFLTTKTDKKVISGSINGSGHYNFSDMGYVSFLKRTSMLGPIDGVKSLQIMNGITLSYLDHHLKGEVDPTNSWLKIYPEWNVSRSN